MISVDARIINIPHQQITPEKYRSAQITPSLIPQKDISHIDVDMSLSTSCVTVIYFVNFGNKLSIT